MQAADQRTIELPTSDDTPYLLQAGRTWLVIVAGLIAALTLRGLFIGWTLQQGFIEYNADGFSRVIRGWEWLQTPRWEVELWLPLHFWLYGAVFWLWDDLFLASRVLNIVLGLVIIVLVYLIGATLKDRATGLLAAVVVAVAPWEIWLSVSGMSEPLFHVLIVASVYGLSRWWQMHDQLGLLGAALALMAATAVRYEAWFFVAAFLGILAIATFIQRSGHFAWIVAAGVISISFMMLWIQQNWAAHGDALAFARGTEAAKLAEDPGNLETGIWERVTYFPSHMLATAPGVVMLGLVASVLLLVVARDRWWPVVVFIWGQAAMLVAVTSLFASQGPGAERYLLANTLLLIVPIAAAGTWLIDRYCRRGLIAAGLGVLFLFVTFLPDWTSPPDHYPASDTRVVAAEVGDFLGEDPDAYVYVLLPPIPDERFNEGYAVRVRSGYPDRVVVTDTPSVLYEAVQMGEATRWVMVDGSGERVPQAVEQWAIGEYQIGISPIPAVATAEPDLLTIGEAFTVTGDGFMPGEPIATWWTGPDETVTDGPSLTADDDGSVVEMIASPESSPAGTWALTLSGQESQRQAIVFIEVDQ